jgi:hypothetical protein
VRGQRSHRWCQTNSVGAARPTRELIRDGRSKIDFINNVDDVFPAWSTCRLSLCSGGGGAGRAALAVGIQRQRPTTTPGNRPDGRPRRLIVAERLIESRDVRMTAADEHVAQRGACTVEFKISEEEVSDFGSLHSLADAIRPQLTRQCNPDSPRWPPSIKTPTHSPSSAPHPLRTDSSASTSETGSVA